MSWQVGVGLLLLCALIFALVIGAVVWPAYAPAFVVGVIALGVVLILALNELANAWRH